jgi:type I restriction enzyme S subunit
MADTTALRNKILQLAIEGKLVEQRAEEGDARALFDEIKAEKTQLIAEKKIKKDKSLAPISDADKTFDIPENWVWVRLGEIGEFTNGYTPKKNELNSNNKGIPYFKVSDMNTEGNELYLSKTSLFVEKTNKKIFPKGSIVYPKNGGALLTNKKRILAQDSVVDLNTGCFNPCKHLFLEYIFSLFVSIDFRDNFKGSNLPTLDMDTMRNLPIPLPPLGEQKRIVEKLDEVMKALDEIEQGRKNIEALKATLRNKALQLAIEGKLVEQRAEEGDARALLDEIKAEKAQLIAEKKIKKDKPLAPIDDSEIPFDIPDSWVWVRLGEVCDKVVDGDHNPPNGESEATNFLMLSSQNINYDRLVDLDKVRYLKEDVFAIENSRTKVQIGDIFFTSVGTIGRSCVYSGGLNICFQRSVSVIHTLIYNTYLKRVLDSPFVQTFTHKHSSGTAQQGFYLNQLVRLLIPLPPLGEQKRIVEKLDEVMAEIDKL